MQIDTDKMAQQCIDAINDKIKNLKTLNIIAIGKSGVGKSTLINSLFRGNFAETGLGRPVTSEIRKKVKKDYPLAIYDTPGFELSSGQQNKVKDEILDIIQKGFASKDINNAIHCIWYCVNVGGNRTFDESEIKWLKEFTAENKVTHVPIIVVLTQAIPKKKAAEMKKLVEAENLDIVKVVPLLAQDMDFDDEYIARSYGLDTLIDVMAEVLPVELQNTLQNVQKASLESKKKASQAVIATAVAGSFGEGFAPIPFSDAALLVPTQVGMIAGITVIFGLDINKSFLTSFVTANVTSKKEKNKRKKKFPLHPLKKKKNKKRKKQPHKRVHARKIPAGKLEEQCLLPHRRLGIFICLWGMLLYSKVDRFFSFKRFHAIESVYGVEEFGSFLHLWRILLCSPTP